MNEEQKQDQEQIEETNIPTEVKPPISAPTDEAAVPTEVRPFAYRPIKPLRPHPPFSRTRRALLIGGVTAAAIVGGGAVAISSLMQTSQKPFPAAPTVRPVHFAPSQPVLRLAGYTGTIANVVWSPDGRYLAASGVDYGSFALVWDTAAFLRRTASSLQTIDQPIRRWGYGYDGLDLDQVSWTSDGRYLLTTILDSSLSNKKPALLDTFNSTNNPHFFTNRNIKDPFFWTPVMSPQGSILAAVDNPSMYRYSKVALWQLQAPTEPYASVTYRDAAQFIGDESGIEVMNWSCDSTRLAGVTSHQEVVVWEMKNHTVAAVVKLPERVPDGRYTEVLSVSLWWSPTDPHVLAVTNFDTIAVIDIQQKKVLHQLITDDQGALNSTEDPQNPAIFYPSVLGITWSPDGRYLAGSYTHSPKVFVWDLQAKNARTEHGLTLQSTLFSPNGTDQEGTVNDLSWSPNGRYLAVASSNQPIIVWQVGS